MATLSPWQKLHTKVSQESEQCTRKPVTVISSRGLRVERGTCKVASIKVTRSIIEHGNRPTTAYLISWSMEPADLERLVLFHLDDSDEPRYESSWTILVSWQKKTRLYGKWFHVRVVKCFSFDRYDCYRDYNRVMIQNWYSKWYSKFPNFRYWSLINYGYLLLYWRFNVKYYIYLQDLLYYYQWTFVQWNL